MPTDLGKKGVGRTALLGNSVDGGLDQLLVALEDARDEATALARERDAAVGENLALARERDAALAESRDLRATLAEEKAQLARREAAAQADRRRFEAAEALLASRETERAAGDEAFQLAFEELQVTAEELAESNGALREREEHLRLIFDGAVDHAILALDLEGRVTEWNAGAERLLGFSETEVLRQRPDAIWTPEDRAAREPEIERRLAARNGRVEAERWHLRKDGFRFWASGSTTALLGVGGELRGFLKILRDRTAARAEEERGRTLVDELSHRVKNTLAVVQSIAAQTLRHAGLPGEAQAVLLARLAALARSHDLLTRNHGQGVSLPDMMKRTLKPYAGEDGEGRIALAGPPVRLAARAAVTLNLAFHELATNAAKYGALSVPGGRVEVRWSARPAGGDAPAAEVVWRERGGPPVRPPGRRGFGSRLIERGLAQESGAEARLDFAPAGVECRIRLPLAAKAGAAQESPGPRHRRAPGPSPASGSPPP